MDFVAAGSEESLTSEIICSVSEKCPTFNLEVNGKWLQHPATEQNLTMNDTINIANVDFFGCF